MTRPEDVLVLLIATLILAVWNLWRRQRKLNERVSALMRDQHRSIHIPLGELSTSHGTLLRMSAEQARRHADLCQKVERLARAGQALAEVMARQKGSPGTSGDAL